MDESSAVDDDLAGFEIVAGAESKWNLHGGHLLVCKDSLVGLIGNGFILGMEKIVVAWVMERMRLILEFGVIG
jgi:hypothetical protein